MGARGPKALPKVVHMAKGNPSKLRLAALDDGSRIPIEIPEAPEHLLPAALVEWNRITKELEQIGLIARVDRAALAVYCQAYARWAGAETKLNELGEAGLIDCTPGGYKQIGVWLQISNRAVEQMHKFLAEFGMSPSARTRVTVNLQQDLFANEQTAQQKAKDYFAKP